MDDITPEDLAKACELDPRFQEANLTVSPEQVQKWLEAGEIQLQGFGSKAYRLAGGVAQIYRLLDLEMSASTPTKKVPQKKQPLRDNLLASIPLTFSERVKEVEAGGWGKPVLGTRQEVAADVIANLLLDPKIQEELRRIRGRWGISPEMSNEDRKAWRRSMEERQQKAEQHHKTIALLYIPGDLKTPYGREQVFKEWLEGWLAQQYQAWEALLSPENSVLVKSMGRDWLEQRAYSFPTALPQETYNFDLNRLVWLLGGDPGDFFWRNFAENVLWTGAYTAFFLFNKVTLGALHDEFGGRRAVQIVIHTRHITLQELLKTIRREWKPREHGNSIISTIQAVWGKYEPPKARRAFLETVAHLPTPLKDRIDQETADLTDSSEDDKAFNRIVYRIKKRRSRLFRLVRGKKPKH